MCYHAPMNRKHARDMLWSLLGLIIPSLIILAYTPIYIDQFGLAFYGKYIVLMAVVLFLCFLDGNLPDFISLRMRDGEFGSSVGESFVLSAFIGLLISILFLISAIALKYALNIMPSTSIWVIPCISAITFFSIINGWVSGALRGASRFRSLSMYQWIYSAAPSTLLLLYAIYGHDNAVYRHYHAVGGLLSILAGRSVVVCAAQAYMWGSIGVRMRLPSASTLRDYWRFARWNAAGSISGSIMSFAERLGLYGIIGADMVGVFHTAVNISMKLTTVPTALNNILFPRFRANGMISTRPVNIIWAVQTATISVFIVWSHVLMYWWIPSIGGMLWVSTIIMTISIWLSSPSYIIGLIFMAEGRSRVMGRMLVMEIVPYITAIYLLMDHYGLYGLVSAFALKGVVESIYVNFANGSLPHYIKSTLWYLPCVVVALLSMRGDMRSMVAPTLIIILYTYFVLVLRGVDNEK